MACDKMPLMPEKESIFGRFSQRLRRQKPQGEPDYQGYIRKMRRTKDPVERSAILNDAILAWEASERAMFEAMPTSHLINEILPTVQNALEEAQGKLAKEFTLKNRGNVEDTMRLARILYAEIDKRTDAQVNHSQQGSL